MKFVLVFALFLCSLSTPSFSQDAPNAGDPQIHQRIPPRKLELLVLSYQAEVFLRELEVENTQSIEEKIEEKVQKLNEIRSHRFVAGWAQSSGFTSIFLSIYAEHLETGVSNFMIGASSFGGGYFSEGKLESEQQILEGEVRRLNDAVQGHGGPKPSTTATVKMIQDSTVQAAYIFLAKLCMEPGHFNTHSLVKNWITKQKRLNKPITPELFFEALRNEEAINKKLLASVEADFKATLQTMKQSKNTKNKLVPAYTPIDDKSLYNALRDQLNRLNAHHLTPSQIALKDRIELVLNGLD